MYSTTDSKIFRFANGENLSNVLEKVSYAKYILGYNKWWTQNSDMNIELIEFVQQVCKIANMYHGFVKCSMKKSSFLNRIICIPNEQKVGIMA